MLEESNVEQRRVKIQKLEEVHLECENVFQFGLCPRHLCQHKKSLLFENPTHPPLCINDYRKFIEPKTATLGSILPLAHKLPQKFTHPISSRSLPTSHKTEIQQNDQTH